MANSNSFGSGGNGGSAGDDALLHDMPYGGPIARWFLSCGKWIRTGTGWR